MSGMIPWDEYWYQPSPPQTVEAALAKELRFWPVEDTGELVVLFETLQAIAHRRGHLWSLPSTYFIAHEIRRAIMAYAEEADGHGLEPRRLEDWLHRSRGLARELASILRSKEGQDRFADVIDQGYPNSEIDHPFGADPANNLLLTLLDKISSRGPMTGDEARRYASERSELAHQRWEAEVAAKHKAMNYDAGLSRREFAREESAYDLAEASDEGQAIMAKIKELWAVKHVPSTRDPVRRNLMVGCIKWMCMVMGKETEQSLITGQGRPWTLLQEMIAHILEYVGRQRGAPVFEPGQEVGDFRHALTLATVYAQDEDLRSQMRVLAWRHLDQVPNPATEE